MTEFEQYAKMLLARLDMALRVVEGNDESDKKNGELCISDKFSRGYALGYVHALSNAYDALPDWTHDAI